jgi:L,D-transpeptidase YcbB
MIVSWHYMIKLNLFILFITVLFFACHDTDANSSITSANNSDKVTYVAITNLVLDSIQVDGVLKKHNPGTTITENVREFYKKRNYQYSWFNEEGVAEQAKVFWDLHNQYINYSQDSSFFDKQLHEQMEVVLNEDEKDWHITDEEKAELEIHLTIHFFDYAKSRYTGKLDPSELQWNIPVRKIDAVALLDSLIHTKGKNLEDWEPLNSQYGLMKNELLKYYELEKVDYLNKQITADKKVYKPGDSSSVLIDVKRKLQAFGDMQKGNVSQVYDNQFEQAVIRFQHRHGLKEDGIAGPAFFRELNVPVEERIQQLLINMERMRWLPQPGEGTRIVANIPSFKLHVYEGEKQMFSMDIVVGKAGTRTVIFNDKLEHIVFSPYWNIPRSITRNEIVPAMNRNPNYLARNNMEITGNSNGLPVIRQKPGPNNSLGKVKFLFPNRYAIYFHDTPAKSLFERDQRAFSHGCIRVKEPHKLASYLLRDDNAWNDKEITNAMNRSSEKWVNLKKPVPVVISYFTAYVDEDGKLNFRDDIYGHDKKMISRLFSHTSH